MINCYPSKAKFVFTIFDDTDVATYNNIRPVYDYLYDIGILTTKSVWPLRSPVTHSYYAGSHTLEDPQYAAYMQLLHYRGFEIAFHGAAMESSKRADIERAFEQFKDRLGFYPRSYACHSQNLDNLYWGSSRFSFPFFRLIYPLIYRKGNTSFYGHRPDSVYFWGNLCMKHIDYVRTFTFSNLDICAIRHSPIYNSHHMPYVNCAFLSSDADNVEEFNTLLNESNQEKLVQNGGVCIISTHFGKGFVDNDRLNKRTAYLLHRLALNNGWFAPVSHVLDHFRNNAQSNLSISRFELFHLEFKWLIDSFRRRKFKQVYNKTEIRYL